MEDFKFNCPHCQQPIAVPEELMGQEVECPSCNGRIELPPSPTASSEPAPPAAPPAAPPTGKKQILIKGRPMTPLPQTSTPSANRSSPPVPDAGARAAEKKEIAKSVFGGLGMMVGAVVWFVAGYYAGYIYFYPPILFIAGLFAMVKGIVKAVAARKGR